MDECGFKDRKEGTIGRVGLGGAGSENSFLRRVPIEQALGHVAETRPRVEIRYLEKPEFADFYTYFELN